MSYAVAGIDLALIDLCTGWLCCDWFALILVIDVGENWIGEHLEAIAGGELGLSGDLSWVRGR